MNETNEQQPVSKVLQELTDTIKHWLRPYVVVDIVPRQSINMLYFRIRNVGQVPAYNISLSVDPPISIHKREASELGIFDRGIGVLAPQDELSFFLNSAVELFNNPDAVLKFDVTVQYKKIKII